MSGLVPALFNPLLVLDAPVVIVVAEGGLTRPGMPSDGPDMSAVFPTGVNVVTVLELERGPFCDITGWLLPYDTFFVFIPTDESI